MPLDSIRIIPVVWSRHHAEAIPTSMDATVTIGFPDGPPVPDGDDFTQPYTQDYVGPARVQALNDSQQELAAGQTISGRSYLVQLDFNRATADLRPGMRCRVTSALNDAHLVDQDLWVVDPQFGSERFTRDLVCSDNQTDAPGAS